MILFAWSEFNGLRFNFAKCAVLHFGAKNLNFVCNVNNNVLPSSESVQDLGVTRNTKFTYEEHCVNIIRRANCTCSHILRTFTSRNLSFYGKVSYCLCLVNFKICFTGMVSFQCLSYKQS